MLKSVLCYLLFIVSCLYMKSQSYEQNAFFLDSNASTRDVALNRQFTNSGKITFASQPLVYGAAISGHAKGADRIVDKNRSDIRILCPYL